MKFIPLALLLSLATQLHAQEKFIEVTVSDTVLAEAQTFVYELTAGTEDDYPYGPRSNPEQAMEQQKRRSKRALDSLVLALKQKGFTPLPLTAQDTFTMITLSGQTFSRRFLVHTIDSLSRLYQLIKNKPHILALVKAGVAADESPYQQTLWKKLIAEATDKAEHIATFSHRHITGILSVTDKPEEKTAGGWTSYPPLSRAYELAGWHTTLGPSDEQVVSSTWPINTLYIIRGAFVVRFSVE